MNYDLVVFDLDGVLIDSREANYEAFRHGLERVGSPAPSSASVEALIGLLAVDMLRRLGCPEDLCERAYLDHVRPFYLENLPTLARAVTGAPEVLEHIRALGKRVGACTSGDRKTQEAALRSLGLRDFIQEMQTPCDSAYRKPDPAYLGELVARFDSASRVFHVEDTDQGLRMGREFGAVTIFAAYGFGSPGEESPDYVLRELGELPGVLGDKV